MLSFKTVLARAVIAVIGGPSEVVMVVLFGDGILCLIPANIDEGE